MSLSVRVIGFCTSPVMENCHAELDVWACADVFALKTVMAKAAIAINTMAKRIFLFIYGQLCLKNMTRVIFKVSIKQIG